jgi:hypothetical protein
MAESDKESELRDESEAGQRFSSSGCFIALSGIAIPVVMFSIPSIFPGTGSLQFGWAGIGLTMVLTPLLVIMGIVVFFGGSRRTSKAEDELGPPSDRSPEFNW